MFESLAVIRIGSTELAVCERAPRPFEDLDGFAPLTPQRAARELLGASGMDARRVLARIDRPAGRHVAGDAVAQLVDLVRNGRLWVAQRSRAFGGIVFAPPAPEVAQDLAELAPVEPEPEPPPLEPTFAAFRLVDDRGNPIAEHAFTFQLPDGQFVEAVTGPDGRFEVDPVHAEGECVLRFAEL